MSMLGKPAWLKARLEMRCCLTAAADVERTQEDVLLRWVRRHAGSLYGRRYGFASIRSARQSGERAPLVTVRRHRRRHRARPKAAAGPDL